MITRTPALARRPPAMSPASVRALEPTRMIGFLAAFSAFATAAIRAESGRERTGAASTGLVSPHWDHAQSAGRINVAGPPAPALLCRTASEVKATASCAVSAVDTQTETGPASAAISELRGASRER